MQKYFQLFKTYRLPILSGLLIGFSWIPFPPWALLIGYIPLWIFCSQTNSLRQIFWGAWITQFVLSLIGFFWVAHLVQEFGGFPAPLAFITLLLFASLMHIYIPLSHVLAFFLAKKRSLNVYGSLVITSCLLVLSETFWPAIFKWNQGYPFMLAPLHFSQWADVVGFLGLSFLTYVIQACFVGAWVDFRQAHFTKVVSGILMLLIGLEVGGYLKKESWAKTDSELKVLLVQANIGNSEKIMAEKGRGFQGEIISQYQQLTRQGLTQHPATELIMWPESAFPAVLSKDYRERAYSQILWQFVGEIQKPLLTGAYGKDSPNAPRPKDYNAVFLLDPSSQSIQEYRKTQLLIFGEYFPFADTFPKLADLTPAGSGFGRGSGPTVFTGQVEKGLQICYESLDPFFSQALVQKGAEILFNVTNDSWFGPHSEPEQHLQMTLGRALETRRPLIRSTNTGISTVIQADGTVLEMSPKFQPWTGFYTVPYLKNPPMTFYSLTAPYWSLVYASLIFFCLFAPWFKRKQDTL